MHRDPARALAALLLVAAWSSPALGGTFADDGAYRFDPQAVATIDFEEPDPSGDLSIAEDAGALSGSHVLELGTFQGEDIDITLPEGRRTYRVSVWIRGHETIGDMEISYSDRVDEVASLYPTGRITSDGWVELANDGLRVDGERLVRATVGLFAAGDAAVDAIEVVADGDASALPPIPNAPCGGVEDAGACGEGQICVWSECRNVAGWVPPIPEDRDDVTGYLEGRLQYLFGPYRERAIDLPEALAAMDAMRAAKDRWSYWGSFLLAVRRLHDGHTTTSGIADYTLHSPRRFSVCFIEGIGDLSQSIAMKDPDYLDVLVSHTGADHNLGLAPGDRLVRVDGQHPIAWARSLIDINWTQPSISNHETFAEIASRLRDMISRYAHTIEVIRCDAATSTCGPIETIDVSAIPLEPPDTPVDARECDNRPLRHVPNAPLDHAPSDDVYFGVVNESDDIEKIYGMEWESLYTTNGQDGVGAALKAAISTFKFAARGVILDHRLGFGGTVIGDNIVWSFGVPRHASDVYQDRQRAGDELPPLTVGQAIFDEALANGGVTWAGTANPVLDVPVALLITEDVSASDWLALGMQGAPRTRIFGPFQTNGGFSTRYAFGYWLGMNYVMAVGDTFLPDGRTHNGMGVEPDVVVRPMQSDLLGGKDSVYEAALAWIRTELQP